MVGETSSSRILISCPPSPAPWIHRALIAVIVCNPWARSDKTPTPGSSGDPSLIPEFIYGSARCCLGLDYSQLQD